MAAARQCGYLRFEGKEVSIRRYGRGVLLEPVDVDLEAWFDALDRFDEPFMEGGRDQPPALVRQIFA